MIYIVKYQSGSSEDIKLAQIEAEGAPEAIEKVNSLFSELSREHVLIDVTPLNDIRKLDMYE